MAYVGTPRVLGSARDTLASIIQGEAGGEGTRGMQAVAQVIQNRANQNFSGYGTSLVDQATARNQFQGQSSNPSAAAYAVADQALNGTLPNVVGNGAVNYANPGDSSARWARNLDSSNSFQVGNHYFTDNTRGRPYSPDLGSAANGNATPQDAGTGTGSNTAPGTVTTDAGDGTITSQSADGSSVTLGGSNPSDSPVGADGGSVANPFGANLGGGGFPSLSGAIGSIGSALGLPSGVTSAIQSALGFSGATGAIAAVGGSNIVGVNAAGPVQATPELVGAVNSQSRTIQQGDQGIQRGIQTAGQTIGQAITTQSQSWQSLFSDTFLRLAFIIAGLVVFAAALLYFARPQVEAAAGAVANALPAGKALKALKAVT